MSCNHKKSFSVLSATAPRKKPSIVPSDDVLIRFCPSCESIRIDTRNEFVFSQGRWMKLFDYHVSLIPQGR